jgi:hypothetical protein
MLQPYFGRVRGCPFTPKMGTWESIGTPKTSEFDCKGQNTLHQGVLCIIEKLSKRRCRKWDRMNHLNIHNTSYVKKKGRKSNWQFDSWPLKVGNRPDPGVCRWSATHRWKALDEGYNFASYLIAIRSLHKKLCTLKVAGVVVIRISGLALRSPGTKSHLDVAPMESCRVYYMGEGGGFPQVQAVMNLVDPESPVACPRTKGAQKSDLTNLWLVGCRFKWVIKSLSLFLIPSWSFSTPLYPF